MHDRTSLSHRATFRLRLRPGRFHESAGQLEPSTWLGALNGSARAFLFSRGVHMEITFSKRKTFFSLLVVLATIAAGVLYLKLSGKTAAQAVGLDSGRQAALAGAQAFYSVDYRESQDVWAARLCALSTQPACNYYQNTAAPFFWPGFTASQTIVNADVSAPVLLADERAGSRQDAPMQVWQVSVSLSAPWPQSDGQIAFPAYVLVVREADGWFRSVQAACQRGQRYPVPDRAARRCGLPCSWCAGAGAPPEPPGR